MPADDSSLLAPLRKSVLVPRDIDSTFRIFTSNISEWWPKQTHSVGLDRTDQIIFEGRVGGRVYERSVDGAVEIWGTVVAWDPPRSFSMTWHPGRGEETSQSLDVTFSTVERGTRVQLVQTGWERLTESAAAIRRGYEGGWDTVFEKLLLSIRA